MSENASENVESEALEPEPQEPVDSGPKYRVAAVGDVHARLDLEGKIRTYFRGLEHEADLLLLAGDVTDHGTPEEAELVVEELSQVRIPKIAVLGNHDYESGQEGEVRKIFAHGGIKVLDGDIYIHDHKLGIAGVKGFAGGFGTRTLEPWGEQLIKTFVLEAVNEALKLERALSRLSMVQKKIALLHYSPCRQTIEGEPTEIAPFLGTSRLAEPLDKFRVPLAIHGHAHRGSHEGHTRGGVRVLNVAMPLLKQTSQKRYVVVEV